METRSRTQPLEAEPPKAQNPWDEASMGKQTSKKGVRRQVSFTSLLKQMWAVIPSQKTRGEGATALTRDGCVRVFLGGVHVKNY